MSVQRAEVYLLNGPEGADQQDHLDHDPGQHDGSGIQGSDGNQHDQCPFEFKIKYPAPLVKRLIIIKAEVIYG